MPQIVAFQEFEHTFIKLFSVSLSSLQTLGQVGEVKKWLPSDDVLVRVNKSRWIYNSRCLVPAPEADLPNNDGMLMVVACACVY